MTGKQLCGILFLCAAGSLLGLIISGIVFSVCCGALYFLGFLAKADAICKLMLAMIVFTVLGFVLGLIHAIKIGRGIGVALGHWTLRLIKYEK